MCFVANTQVYTPSGYKNIQDIHVGDKVLSYNEHKGRVEPARVSSLITGQRTDLMVISTKNGAVTCSQNHRFYTFDKMWIKASALSSSDKLMMLTAHSTTVAPVSCTTNRKDLNSPVIVHNLEVEGNHDYFVGPDAILCHNHK